MGKIPPLWEKILGSLTIVLSLLLATAPEPLPAQETLKIAGTGSAMGSMEILARAFMKANPEIQIGIIPRLGSSGAIKAVSKGVIGIAISARTLTGEERGMGMSIKEYARTPLVFATHRGVRVRGVTHDEVVRIYRGEKSAWAGGTPIRIVLRQRNETDTHIISQISPVMNGAVEFALSRRGMITALTDQDNAGLLESISGSFGASTLAQVISEHRQVRVLTYNGNLLMN